MPNKQDNKLVAKLEYGFWTYSRADLDHAPIVKKLMIILEEIGQGRAVYPPDLVYLYLAAQRGAIALGFSPYTAKPNRPHRGSVRAAQAREIQDFLANITVSLWNDSPIQISHEALRRLSWLVEAGAKAFGLPSEISRRGPRINIFAPVNAVRAKMCIGYHPSLPRRQYRLADALREEALANALEEARTEMRNSGAPESHVERASPGECRIARWHRRLEVAYHELGEPTAAERAHYRDCRAQVTKAQRSRSIKPQ